MARLPELQARRGNARMSCEIGLKLAREMWGGKYQIIVATHLDKGHLHNHFCFNSVSYLEEQQELLKIGAEKVAGSVRPLMPRVRIIGD